MRNKLQYKQRGRVNNSILEIKWNAKIYSNRGRKKRKRNKEQVR